MISLADKRSVGITLVSVIIDLKRVIALFLLLYALYFSYVILIKT